MKPLCIYLVNWTISSVRGSSSTPMDFDFYKTSAFSTSCRSRQLLSPARSFTTKPFLSRQTFRLSRSRQPISSASLHSCLSDLRTTKCSSVSQCGKMPIPVFSAAEFQCGAAPHIKVGR
ncbi:hypothetical protein M438DRAFT_2360 [Aureobasidium pullulans EXF-150]|uniref:Uncharacterized protein n=1 Tax=Aureobasidium pullulans EXF-150 TaxID=1043002 RepID=A0A074XUC7_AURPU|nr:uncharacterized protein M438DRAFT_2360 [Aureobasidium pullulans EXF-150]KEQ89183.1 hypothetical protein M438DRAFT_2360 [Aureobasidium pullulans EXF-150]